MNDKLTCKYKFILFDLDETLTYFKNPDVKDIVNDVLNDSGIVTEYFWSNYDSIKDKLISNYFKNVIGDEEFRLQGSFNVLKEIHKDADNISRSINKIFINSLHNVKLYDDVIPFLDRLTLFDVKTALLTNGPYVAQKSKIKSTGLYNYFQRVYISGEVGYSKPDKRFFSFALNDLGAFSEEAVFIGNSIENDYKGAYASGIDFVLMDRKKCKADFTGHRVTELKELIRYIS